MRISDWSSDVCSSDLDSLLALERPVLDSWTVSGGFSFAYEIIDEKADTGEGERSFQLFGLPMTASRDTTAFSHLQAMDFMSKGHMLADTTAIQIGRAHV